MLAVDMHGLVWSALVTPAKTLNLGHTHHIEYFSLISILFFACVMNSCFVICAIKCVDSMIR